MTIHEIQSRNHSATVRRGLLSEFTTKQEFTLKLFEEVAEFARTETDEHEAEELADVMIVCLTCAKHYGIDIMNEMRKKTLKNESRE